MKKIISLLLSIIMITTSICTVNISAFANEEAPSLPLSGATELIIAKYDHMIKNSKHFVIYSDTAGTLRVNFNAVLTGSDYDGEFNIVAGYKGYLHSIVLPSGPKGFVNDYIDIEVLPGKYEIYFSCNKNDCDVKCSVTTSFIPFAQSFYADNTKYRSLLAFANEISLDTPYYGVYPGMITSDMESRILSIYNTEKTGKDGFAYKFNIESGDLYISISGPKKPHIDNSFTYVSDYFSLYDSDGNKVSVLPGVNGHIVGNSFKVSDLKSGQYFFVLDNWIGPYTIALSQSYIDSSKESKSSSSSNKLTAKSTTSSITLSWPKQDGVKKYTVEKYNSKKKKWQKVKTVNTNKITIKKLNSATTYKFKIKAKNYSKTITAATCPSKVPYIGAKFIYQGEKEIDSVAWDKVKGASGYEIEFKNTDNGTKKKVTVKGNKKTLYKTPAKWTHARIRAYKKVGNKKYYGTYTSYKEIRG